jgi:hypothetical protein
MCLLLAEEIKKRNFGSKVVVLVRVAYKLYIHLLKAICS